MHEELTACVEIELPRSDGRQEAALAHRDLLRGFAQLSDEQRSVLFLIGVEDLSYEEAAGVLAIPIGTVMSRLSRARERLHQYMSGGQKPRIKEPRRTR